jgi:hypothetical protein
MSVGNSGVGFAELCIVKDIQNSYFSVMEETNLIYKIAGKSMRCSTQFSLWRIHYFNILLNI